MLPGNLTEKRIGYVCIEAINDKNKKGYKIRKESIYIRIYTDRVV
jgi:hypothetical protein